MATVTTLTSDLTEKPIVAGRTLKWGFDGQDYEIDLENEEIDAFYSLVKDMMDHSRQVDNRPVIIKSGAITPKHSPEQLAEIREVARELGFEVADRGRIKGEILEAVYEERSDLRLNK